MSSAISKTRVVVFWGMGNLYHAKKPPQAVAFEGVKQREV